MKFTAIVTSHENPRGLRAILGNLRYQTRPPDEILVFYSDTPDVARLREDFSECIFIEDENRNDWGHHKRSLGVAMARGEYLGFFNDDDSYHNDYIAKMLGVSGDVVFCDWSGIANCQFRPGLSTSGNFIVRTDLARKARYTGRHYEADGQFIDAINSLNPRIVKVTERLYSHNSRKR